MLKLLLKLWPAALPILIYWLWRKFRRGKAAEDKLSPLESRLWIATLVLSLVIAIVCIVVMGAGGEGGEGTYVRPQYEGGGKVIPGHVEPKEKTQ